MTEIRFPEWISQAESLYQDGIAYTKIADIVGADRKTVSHYLRKKGYKSNPKYARNIDPNKLRKYDYSFENIFEKIDTPEKAYWLGMLYADGNVSDERSVIEISLKEADYEHVVKFKNFLGASNKITRKTKIDGNKVYIGFKLSLNSAKMKSDLIKLGCHPRKTDDILFPTTDQVPVHLQSHFVRGYFDGDGCITKGSTSNVVVELLGTEAFLIEYMNWTGLHHNSVNGFDHSDISRVAYAGRYAIHILKKIYEDATIYLERKYDRYLFAVQGQALLEDPGL